LDELRHRGIDLDSSTNEDIKAALLSVGGETFFQPLMPGIDPNQKVPVVSVQRRLISGVYEEALTEIDDEKKDEILARTDKDGMVTNQFTGIKWKLQRGGSSLNHIINGRGKQSNHFRKTIERLEAAVNIPELFVSAIPAQPRPPNKKQESFKAIHRFYSAMELDGVVYVVKITGREYQKGLLKPEGLDIRRLYGVGLEKEMLPKGSGPESNDSTSRLRGSISELTVRQMLEGINDEVTGEPFFQGEKQNRGSIQFGDKKTLISLFKNANLSTFLHEPHNSLTRCEVLSGSHGPTSYRFYELRNS
jgi:hypothetical protein